MTTFSYRHLFTTLRGWSWLLGGLSLLPVAFLGYEYRVFSVWAKQQAENGGFVCGTGLVALTMLCMLVASLISFSALVCAGMAYKSNPAPRGARRKLEVAAVGIVVVLLGAAFAMAALASLFH